MCEFEFCEFVGGFYWFVGGWFFFVFCIGCVCFVVCGGVVGVGCGGCGLCELVVGVVFWVGVMCIGV